jgi:hypothetical protein
MWHHGMVLTFFSCYYRALLLFSEGEQEAEWLRLAGLSQLTAAYEQGRELPDSELNLALRRLPGHYAEAVRRRVKTLNLTVRQRGRQQRSRARKPDIRDVFRDVEVCLLHFYVTSTKCIKGMNNKEGNMHVNVQLNCVVID